MEENEDGTIKSDLDKGVIGSNEVTQEYLEMLLKTKGSVIKKNRFYGYVTTNGTIWRGRVQDDGKVGILILKKGGIIGKAVSLAKLPFKIIGLPLVVGKAILDDFKIHHTYTVGDRVEWIYPDEGELKTGSKGKVVRLMGDTKEGTPAFKVKWDNEKANEDGEYYSFHAIAKIK